jgi:hypothetical protein
MGDLAKGMHASIGAPGRMQTYWPIGQACQTGFQGALDRDRMRLELPAVITRATIFEQQLKATRR